MPVILKNVKFLSFLTGLSLISCNYFLQSQQEEDPNYIPSQTYQKPVTNPNDPTNSTTPGAKNTSSWGIVKCNRIEDFQDFNLQVRRFLSTSENPNNLPGISCTNDRPGGFFFRGSITFKGDVKFSKSSNSSATFYVHENSYIEIHVTDGKNRPILKKPIELFSAPVAGQISPEGLAVLNFKDQKGEVSLEGEVGEEFFTGEFKYKNYTDWEGAATGFEGKIGPFKIRTCMFFKCN